MTDVTDIEVFRAGSHVDMAGRQHAFTRDDLVALAQSYNAAAEEAPIVVGHPRDDLPAYGWIKRLTVRGDTLVAQPHQVEPQFAAMVRDGRFKKVSVSFWSPEHPSNPTPGRLALKHVGFLGAAPPAVAGLKAAAFAADDQSAAFELDFAASREEIDMPNDNPGADADLAARQAEFAAREEALKAREAAFVAAAAEARQADIDAFLSGLVSAGKLAPGSKAEFASFMASLDDGTIDFSAERKVSPLNWFKSVLASAEPLIKFGAHAAAGPLPADDDPQALSEAALSYQAEQAAKGIHIDIATAVRRVQKGDK